jgi:hypothetical protein
MGEYEVRQGRGDGTTVSLYNDAKTGYEVVVDFDSGAETEAPQGW